MLKHEHRVSSVLYISKNTASGLPLRYAEVFDFKAKFKNSGPLVETQYPLSQMQLLKRLKRLKNSRLTHLSPIDFANNTIDGIWSKPFRIEITSRSLMYFWVRG